MFVDGACWIFQAPVGFSYYLVFQNQDTGTNEKTLENWEFKNGSHCFVLGFCLCIRRWESPAISKYFTMIHNGAKPVQATLRQFRCSLLLNKDRLGISVDLICT